MTVIYLIRHGQANFGQQDYDKLSELGHQQAEILGQSLQPRLGQFDKVVLGSMLRHKQTTQQCLKGMEQDLAEPLWQVDANWNEYNHHDILARFGPEFADAPSIESWVRQQPNPKEAFETLFNKAMARWISGQHDDYEESWQEYQLRIKAGLENVIKHADDAKCIAVFSSGGPISVVSQSLLGVDPAKIMQVNWTLVNCSMTKLVSTGSRVFLSTLNDHSHFEGKPKHLITYK
ncbi:histidine phosphatase family protein [Aliiglaciecola sp. LCG003]|uniref:histidine phosphatase family protein n=1 Tax=Aliiglaciecola sp. LCG003 TaxID=3053655 RepID=UPI002572FC61|nr:histidine phosphatase family protein [Aliiglaciecola sp. LCG003]WJG08551.1 histidine phosphatase family protein [Aliiglaciecola sp. LCG003]